MKSIEKNNNWQLKWNTKDKLFTKFNNKMCTNSRELYRKKHIKKFKRNIEKGNKLSKKLIARQNWPKLNYSKPKGMLENKFSKNRKSWKRN